MKIIRIHSSSCGAFSSGASGGVVSSLEFYSGGGFVGLCMRNIVMGSCCDRALRRTKAHEH